MALSVPTIDISALNANDASKKSQIFQQIGDACEQWGFFYVVNHGIDLDLVEKTTQLGKQFFYMPKTFKDEVARSEDNFQGFSDRDRTKQKVDWKQVFDFTSEEPGGNLSKPSMGVHEKNQWPNIPEFQDTMEKYLSCMQTLARSLFCAILETLNIGLNCQDFVSSVCCPGNEETSVCRLNFYPKCPDPSLHLGVGPHSDPGILTVLLQDSAICSLQVERDGTFYDIPPVKDSFVINIGDMMQVWSNGKYKAPVHRVLANHDSDRFSVPFFLGPAYSCMVEPLGVDENKKRYKAIHFGHFFKAYRSESLRTKGKRLESDISNYKH